MYISKCKVVGGAFVYKDVMASYKHGKELYEKRIVEC